MIGVYVAGDSLLHRARPGAKLLVLLVLTTLLVALPRPDVVTAMAVVVAALALVAGLGARGLGRLVWPLRWIVLVLTPRISALAT